MVRNVLLVRHERDAVRADKTPCVDSEERESQSAYDLNGATHWLGSRSEG